MRTSINKWLICYAMQPSPRVNLVCFPFGGAAASAYRGWAQHVSSSIQIWSVQLPGRENRFSEPFCEHINVLVDMLVEDIYDSGIDNLVFFGHSMGSLFAYLVAFRMNKLGRSVPKLLILSGHGSNTNEGGKCWSKASTPALVEHVELLGGISSDILSNPDFQSMYLSKLRADYRLYESILSIEEAALTSDALIIRGLQDPLIDDMSFEGWKSKFSGDVESISVQGGHFYFTENPSLLIELILNAIDSRIVAI